MRTIVCALLLMAVAGCSAKAEENRAQLSRGPAITGSDNVFIGVKVGWLATTASHNVCIGAHACKNLTTGNRNICIGDDSCPKLTTQNDQAHIKGTSYEAARALWRAIEDAGIKRPCEQIYPDAAPKGAYWKYDSMLTNY